MRIIGGINSSVKSSISLQEYKKNTAYKKSPYTLEIMQDNGMLIYNSLTCELIFMSVDEFCFKSENSDEIYRWLVEHWFYFPQDVDPKSIVYMLKHEMKLRIPMNIPTIPDRFVVLTTTACNARCYYCYEAGTPIRPMTDQRALDVAKYIESHCSQPVTITWFGGEPLCNPNAIRIICNYLEERGVDYHSSMITNGYLVDLFDIDEMRNKWHLRNVQITLDGTKNVYINSKKYKNNDENAYEKVLDNIETLLDNGIRVSIRMNVSKDNGADLHDLAKYLGLRYSCYPNFTVYPRGLFIGCGDPPVNFTDEEELEVVKNTISLEKLLIELGIFKRTKEIYNFPRVHCMADKSECAVITPEGNLTPCEHYIDSEICGNVYEGVTDYETMESWKSLANEYPECATCFNYPRCTHLKKCPSDSVCTPAQRVYERHQISMVMADKYNQHMKREKILGGKIKGGEV